VDLDVLLPFHRNDRYLAEAVDSLCNSSFQKFRVIAIDDRVDQSRDVTYLFKKLGKFDLLRTTGGRGYGRALELGTTAVEASYLALFNSDDVNHRLRFEKQVVSLENSDISITSFKRITSRGKSSSSYAGSISSTAYSPLFLLLGSYGANATWCMRKEWWLKNAFFDESENLDWRIALSSFRNSTISFINEPLYYYRKHSSQITATKNINPERMNVVFEKWRSFAEIYGLPRNTRAIFDAFATPWMAGESLTPEEINIWASAVKGASLNFDSEIQSDLMSLIQRRYLFAVRNSKNSLSSRIIFAIKGSPQIFPLVRETLTPVLPPPFR